MVSIKIIGGRRYRLAYASGRFDSKRNAQSLARQLRPKHYARVVKGKTATGHVGYWVFVRDR